MKRPIFKLRAIGAILKKKKKLHSYHKAHTNKNIEVYIDIFMFFCVDDSRYLHFYRCFGGEFGDDFGNSRVRES